MTFPGNAFCCGTPTLSLFITGETDTSGTVAIPGLGFETPFSVVAGVVTTVPIPLGAHLTTSDTVVRNAVHVTAQADVTVYGLNRIPFTTDAYLGLPTDILGTDYIVLGYKNVDIVNASEFAIVATVDSTAVTITPSETTGPRIAGVPYTIVLNQGDTYQLINTNPAPADLSGTFIASDHPIAVFGGHNCANIPPGFFACDHVIEELTPTTTWGRNFLSMPLATRLGDTFRFIASVDGTTVNVNATPVATLNRGQLFEQIITGPAQITADHPIMVAQYSNSSTFDGVQSDPFMMLVPPFEQFLSVYTVTTPASGFAANFINLVAPAAAVGTLTLDGVAIPTSVFTPIGTSGFLGAQLPVALGSHHLTASRPFGVFVYGFDNFDSYGYPGGMSLAPVAVVTSVSLTPKTATTIVGNEHCVNAAIADQNGKAVVGVRVDFNVTGANTASGSANTDANGVAPFCYTGANTGTDTITATVGTLSDTATNEQRPRQTRFAAFNAEARFRSGRQEFDVEGYFTLGTASDGIDPINEPVTLTAGNLTVTIPAGTFRLETASSVAFEKTIDGRAVEASIAATATPGTFKFEFEIFTPDPTGGVDRIPVELTIGNDAGSTTAKVERRR